MEIERKWLLRTVPQLKPDLALWVNQFYLSTEPEVRLRSVKGHDEGDLKWKYYITIKGDGSLERSEIETTVDDKFYHEALDFANCEEIHKNFLTYFQPDGKKVEVSVILNRPSCVYAEVEFETVTDAVKYQFPWPDLVIEEVTYNPDYKMKNYWKRLQEG